jgi:hypothetical protein
MLLEYSDTPFELNLTEMPNRDMMELISARFNEIDMPFTNPKNPAGDKVRGQAALKIWKDYVSKIDESVCYQSSVKNQPNRMYAKRVSCQGLPKKFRNSLYRYHASDTDAVCCHPTISLATSDYYGLQNDSIRNYIENRPEIFQLFSEKLGYTNGQTKQLYNAILYGQAIPIEINESKECMEMIEKYKKQATNLAETICDKYPQLLKDAKRRDKNNPKFSALSCFLGNIENQIVIKAMNFMAARGIKIYVYTFDGFLHSKIQNADIYNELNVFIENETGVPLRFIEKKMEEFLEFSNVLDVHELVPEAPVEKKEPLDFELEQLMEFNFELIQKYCFDYQHELEDFTTRDSFLKPLLRLCDYFFATIESSDYMVVRHTFHMVHGKKFRKHHIAVKYRHFLATYCADKNSNATRKVGLKVLPCFSLAKDYFEFERRLKYPLINFYPSMEKQPFYNVFKGFHVLPSDNKIDEKTPSIQPVLEHIKNIWCDGNEEYYNYTIRWLAQTIQTPWNRTEVALVLKSAEGSGKGIILNHFISTIMGLYDQDTGAQGSFRTVKKATDVFGQFTNTLEGCCMLFLDELVWGGDKQASGILKALITEPTNKIEFKGVSSYQVRAFQNVLIASNEKWVVPASDNTRRYFVLECNNKYSGIQNAISKTYFDAILNVPIQDVADFFYQFDLTGFNSKEPPLTEALNEQKKMTMDSSFMWAMDSLKDEDSWAEYTGAQPVVNKKGIYERYVKWCEEGNLYRTESVVSFWRDMKMFNFKEFRLGSKGEQVRYCSFPFLDEARQMFQARFKMDDWDDW